MAGARSRPNRVQAANPGRGDITTDLILADAEDRFPAHEDELTITIFAISGRAPEPRRNSSPSSSSC